MCHKFKFQHHEVHPHWTAQSRGLPVKDGENDCGEILEIVEKDILSMSTEYFKSMLELIGAICEKIQKSKFYRVVTATTQPIHAVIMLAALTIAAALNSANNSNSNNIFFKFVYASATAAHFGSQIWMTFASGLSLYFSLPRHHFGEVQIILFPLYFTLTSLFSLATLLAHLRLAEVSGTTLILLSCFLTEFFVRLYLCDPLVRLIRVKNDLEAKHGCGMEVGKLSRDSALFDSREYVSVHGKFRRLHMFIAISNVACIGFSTAHLFISVSGDVHFCSTG